MDVLLISTSDVQPDFSHFHSSIPKETRFLLLSKEKKNEKNANEAVRLEYYSIVYNKSTVIALCIQLIEC